MTPFSIYWAFPPEASVLVVEDEHAARHVQTRCI